jgi:hypothetical protein
MDAPTMVPDLVLKENLMNFPKRDKLSFFSV